MRGRISLAAIAVAAVAGVSLALVVGITPAIGKAGRHARAAESLKVECTMSPTTVPPPGSTDVVAPAASGKQYGGLSCPQSGFYGGTFSDSFQVPDSGDTVGNYIEYLNTGTIRGSFDLTPDEGTFGGAGSFQSQSWTGTISVTSGTGAYKGITGKGGSMSCDSPDSVHLSCVENITLNVPASMARRH